MSPLHRTTLLGLLLLGSCSPADHEPIGEVPDEAHLRAWKEAADIAPTDAPHIIGTMLTYPVGTKTVFSVQVDTLGATNWGIAADADFFMKRSYNGSPPASAQFREYLTVGSAVNTNCKPAKGVLLVIPEFLSPEGAPRQEPARIEPSFEPCQGGSSGASSLHMTNAVPELNQWTQVVEQDADGWISRVWVYASDEPLAYKKGDEGAYIVVDAKAGEALKLEEATLPPIPEF